MERGFTVWLRRLFAGTMFLVLFCSTTAVAQEILLVHHQITERRIWASRLNGAGYKKVVHASTMQGGLQALDERNIALVMLDKMLPGHRGRAPVIDSATMVKRIRSGKHKSVPILVPLNHGRSLSDYPDLKHSGVTDVILEPFRIEELKRKVDRLIREGHR